MVKIFWHHNNVLVWGFEFILVGNQKKNYLSVFPMCSSRNFIYLPLNIVDVTKVCSDINFWCFGASQLLQSI